MDVCVLYTPEFDTSCNYSPLKEQNPPPIPIFDTVLAISGNIPILRLIELKKYYEILFIQPYALIATFVLQAATP